MKKSYEAIKTLQQRTGATFEQADRALVRAKGDPDQAAYELLRKIARKGNTEERGPEIRSRLAGLFTYTLRVERDDRVFVCIPMWVVYILIAVLLLVTNGLYYRDQAPIILGSITLYLCLLLSRCSLHIVPPRRREDKLETMETGELPVEELLARYAEDPVSEGKDGRHTIVVE